MIIEFNNGFKLTAESVSLETTEKENVSKKCKTCLVITTHELPTLDMNNKIHDIEVISQINVLNTNNSIVYIGFDTFIESVTYISDDIIETRIMLGSTTGVDVSIK